MPPFDPTKDEDAFTQALGQMKTKRQAEVSAHQENEKVLLEEARAEIKRRVKSFNDWKMREKQDWVDRAMQKAVPMWVMKQVFWKNRGWILRIYGVTLDRVVFDNSPFEFYEIRKRGKLVAAILFKFDDGKHIEGKF